MVFSRTYTRIYIGNHAAILPNNITTHNMTKKAIALDHTPVYNQKTTNRHQNIRVIKHRPIKRNS